MKITLKEIEDAFFEAMQSGYAQSVPKEKIAELPGAKSIYYVTRDGRFQVRDTWLVTPLSSMSSGFTVIWRNSTPLWMMHYGGWYEESVVPFLKRCLDQAYTVERRFYGGRGPMLVRDGHHMYQNHYEGSFGHFHGFETITDLKDSRRLGFHRFQGYSMLANASFTT